MQTTRSVSDMAAIKFKQLLNRELNLLSASGESGKNIKEHITSTYYEQQLQHEFVEADEEEDCMFTNGSSSVHSLASSCSEGEFIKASKVSNNRDITDVSELSDRPAELN